MKYALYHMNEWDWPAQAFRFMWSSSLILDSLREFRFWVTPPTHCPWGFILIAIGTAGCLGCVAGFCCGIIIASRFCRQLVLQICTIMAESFLSASPWVRQNSLALQQRFRQYRAWVTSCVTSTQHWFPWKPKSESLDCELRLHWIP